VGVVQVAGIGRSTRSISPALGFKYREVVGVDVVDVGKMINGSMISSEV
jgi:hypothetical protein